MDHAQRGAKAVSASDFRTAIEEYTRALIVNSHAPDYYIKRSTAYARLKPEDGGPDLKAALHDAEMAVALAIQRARREQIVAGQMRRGVVLFQLGRIGDAGFIFEIVREKVGKTPQQTGQQAMQASTGEKSRSNQSSIQRELDIWEMKVKAKLSKAGPQDEAVAVKVQESPDIKIPDQEKLKKVYQAQLQAMTGSGETVSNVPLRATPAQEDANSSVDISKGKSTPTAVKPTTAPPKSDSAPEPVAQPPAQEKIRHEWFQSSDNVTVTLYAKGVDKEKTDVEINEDSLSVSFPVASGLDYAFTLDPLYGPVDVSNSKSSIMSTKIEVVLRKLKPGQKWGTLEGTARPAEDGGSTTPISSQPKPSVSAPDSKAPAYPTSSRKGHKDWDKVAASLSKKEKKSKENDAEKDGEDGDDSDMDDYSGDQVDAFFKKLYAGADPDTRRAMMKSYYESEGTSLSTNWSEVGQKRVEPHPPTDD